MGSIGGSYAHVPGGGSGGKRGDARELIPAEVFRRIQPWGIARECVKFCAAGVNRCALDFGKVISVAELGNCFSLIPWFERVSAGTSRVCVYCWVLYRAFEGKNNKYVMLKRC